MSDINDLDLNVDIAVSGPDDYADNSVPPLPIGTYTFRVQDFAFEPSRTAGKAPALLLKSLEVADGEFEGRKVGFQRVYATPFTRKDKSGADKKVSQLADFIRSIDNTFPTQDMDIQAVNSFLQQVVDERRTFRAKLDWEGFDKDHNELLRSQRGVAKNDYKSAAAKEIDREVKLRGRIGFPDGKPVAKNPASGNLVEARVRLTNFYEAK